MGLSAFGAYESQVFLATKVLVALAIVGHFLAYRDHRSVLLMVLGAGGGMLFFIGLYLLTSELVIYLGLGGMLGASVTDIVRRLRARRQFQVHANPAERA